MTLLDRFRRRPAWEHEDPSVRLEGVRELAPGEQDILTSLARSDSDARVRRSALKRVTALAVVVGAVLYVGTRQKKAAVVVVGVGAAVALLTLGVVALAVNSGM